MNLSVSLPESQAEFVRKEIESGRFNSSSEVIRAALQLLQQTERQGAHTLSWLREAWETGVESGDVGELDFESLKHEARARLAAGKPDA